MGFLVNSKKRKLCFPTLVSSNILDILLHTACLENTAFPNVHELNVSQEYILIFIIS